MKRVFGIFEVIFDVCYLVAALLLAFLLLLTRPAGSAGMLAGIMALVLVCGDAFHLLPRMMVIVTKEEEPLRQALGRGKQITSITMTVFYLLLWRIGLLVFAPENGLFWSGLIIFLAVVRILLCLLQQNQWTARYPPVSWGIWRNIPFFLMGAVVAGFFYLHKEQLSGASFMWLAVLLSFLCYLPVVLWSNKNAKIGMLMLPKTCAYLWMIIMCLSL